MKILVIEDNLLLRDNITFFLEQEKFTVDSAEDGETGYSLALKNQYDLIILDLMLPKLDGETVVKYLRSNDITTPILVLSAKNLTEDKVYLLNIGCDDYLTKPFVSAELLARVKAILRRRHNISTSNIEIADLFINTDKKEVKRNNELIDLTTKEYIILELLAYNKNRLVTRRELLEKIWGDDRDLLTMSNSLDVHIKNLRKKIDGKYKKKLIKTKRGFGFTLSE